MESSEYHIFRELARAGLISDKDDDTSQPSSVTETITDIYSSIYISRGEGRSPIPALSILRPRASAITTFQSETVAAREAIEALAVKTLTLARPHRISTEDAHGPGGAGGRGDGP